ALALVDADHKAERIGYPFFECDQIGVLAGASAQRAVGAACFAAFLGRFTRDAFDLAHIETAGHHLLGKSLGVRLPDQHARMARGKLAGVDVGLDRFGKSEKPQRISDVAAALADDSGDLILAVAKLFYQRAIAFRL